jgi:hypothetical protein
MTAVTAALSGKLAAAINNATPTFRAAVVRPTALRIPIAWPADTQPAARQSSTMTLIPTKPTNRIVLEANEKNQDECVEEFIQ